MTLPQLLCLGGEGRWWNYEVLNGLADMLAKQLEDFEDVVNIILAVRLSAQTNKIDTET